MGRTEFSGLPKLKSLCSHLETMDMLKMIAKHPTASNSCSFGDLHILVRDERSKFTQGIQPRSLLSVMTCCCGDSVILRGKLSIQALPSRSKTLCWNLYKPVTWSFSPQNTSNQNDGYSSDALETSCTLAVKNSGNKELSRSNISGLLNGESRNRSRDDNWDCTNIMMEILLYGSKKQWLAVSIDSSSLSRVNEWVSNLYFQSALPLEECGLGDDEETRKSTDFSPLEMNVIREKTSHMTHHSNLDLSEEVIKANNIIKFLNSFTSTARIVGMGLKVIPNISHFASLRSVNLSGNSIVCITPESLPKSIHTLNLSRNKIATVEGLKELTRLRVLDLSYNRISRIGQGLSNCTLIKELYLSGNKIGHVEGVHRLLKLTILDLGFNKIAMTKALGQLVANFNSLLVLNLLGNPIQANLGNEQLRKAGSSLLPQLAYLNKQQLNRQRARGATMDHVAKATLGNNRLYVRRKVNNGQNVRRKVSRQVSQVPLSLKGKAGKGAGSRNNHRS